MDHNNHNMTLLHCLNGTLTEGFYSFCLRIISHEPINKLLLTFFVIQSEYCQDTSTIPTIFLYSYATKSKVQAYNEFALGRY